MAKPKRHNGYLMKTFTFMLVRKAIDAVITGETRRILMTRSFKRNKNLRISKSRMRIRHWMDIMNILRKFEDRRSAKAHFGGRNISSETFPK